MPYTQFHEKCAFKIVITLTSCASLRAPARGETVTEAETYTGKSDTTTSPRARSAPPAMRSQYQGHFFTIFFAKLQGRVRYNSNCPCPATIDGNVLLYTTPVSGFIFHLLLNHGLKNLIRCFKFFLKLLLCKTSCLNYFKVLLYFPNFSCDEFCVD